MKKRKKLYEALELSKIIYDDKKSFHENIVNYLINKSLLNILEKEIKYNYITVYHIDSFYRDNSNDKYELCK